MQPCQETFAKMDLNSSQGPLVDCMEFLKRLKTSFYEFWNQLVQIQS